MTVRVGTGERRALDAGAPPREQAQPAPSIDDRGLPRRPRRRPAPGRGDGRRPLQAPVADRPPGRRNAADRGARGAVDRGRRPREGDRGDRTTRGRGGRPDAPKRPEPRLYALESVVDRGFDDLPEDGDGDARRVHWTIVKRSVADQMSGKAMSAVYVLRRDGTDTEFPNLGAARAAVNKTIVHPEKLTLSKAEHAAARKQ
jgi:hypothetical protein